MKRFLTFLFVIFIFCFAGSALAVNGVKFSLPVSVGEYTVATLPAATLANQYVTVTDGNSATDCTVGGGATSVLCRSTGAAWASAGGGAGVGDVLADGSVPMTGELTVDELGIEFQETDGISDCSGFAATGGGIFYDDSEGIFKKCQDNVLTDLGTGVIPNGTDPDVDALGEESFDTDGDNKSGQAIRRCFDGTNQFACGEKIRYPWGDIVNPTNAPTWTGRTGGTGGWSIPILANNTGMDLILQAICFKSDADFDVNLYETNAWNGMDDDVDSQIPGTGGAGTAFQISDAGDACYTECVEFDPDITIEAGHTILLEDAGTGSGTPNYLIYWGEVWYDADVDQEIEMKKIFLVFAAFLFILFSCSFAIAGTAYYCDLSSPGADPDPGNAGTYADPFVSLTEVNNTSFSTGDDIYFLKTATYTISATSDRLVVDWSGTSGDRVIIGCYDGDGDFECGNASGVDGNRPTIDGDSNTYPASGYAAIHIEGDSYDYITVQDLKIQYTGGYGVLVKQADNVNVDNCYFYRTTGACAVYVTYGATGNGCDTGEITDNVCINKGYSGYSSSGAAIEISGMDWAESTKNITVSGNIVKGSAQEGIGAYKKAYNVTIEDNVVADIKNVAIYIDASKHITVKNNFVYESDTDPGFGDGMSGITVQNEIERGYWYVGNNSIFGNVIAGTGKAIEFGCQIVDCTGVGTPNAACQDDYTTAYCNDATVIYNNSLIDNTYSYYHWKQSSSDSAILKNNFSYHTQAACNGTNCYHTNDDTISGFEFGTNMFNTADDSFPDNADSGSYGYNGYNAIPGITRTSSWWLQSDGTFDRDDAKIVNTSSPAYGDNNAGTDLGDGSTYADFEGDNRDTYTPWDIGADEYADAGGGTQAIIIIMSKLFDWKTFIRGQAKKLCLIYQ